MTATKTFRVNGLIASLAVKAPCKAVSTSNITLSGQQTINSIALVAGDRVLVTGQTDQTENGIYEVETSAWTRAGDFDGNRDVVDGTLVVVASTPLVGFYQLTATDPIVIGTTALTFTVVATLDLAGNLASAVNGAGASLVWIEDLANQFTATNVETALAELKSNAVSKIKTADKSLTTTAVTENDDHLFGWALAADTRYKIEGLLEYTQNIGDIRFQFGVDQALQSSVVEYRSVDNAGTERNLMNDPITGLISITTFADGQNAVIRISGVIRSNSGAASVLDFLWSQNNSHANATTMMEGSWITVTKLP